MEWMAGSHLLKAGGSSAHRESFEGFKAQSRNRNELPYGDEDEEMRLVRCR